MVNTFALTDFDVYNTSKEEEKSTSKNKLFLALGCVVAIGAVGFGISMYVKHKKEK